MPRATVQSGSHGDDVRRVQRYFVRARELDPTHLDGDFGPETQGLVEQFQQDNGLVVDGVVGPQTWAALGDYLEASPTLSEGDLGPDVARLQLALGPLSEALNEGQVYVTLNRLEKAGLVTSQQVGQADRPNRKVYELTAAGRARVMEWLEDTSWPKPAPAEFHLKIAYVTSRASASVRLVDMQRHALLAELAATQRASLGEPDGSVAGLLLEGVVLRLQADLRWLEACARHWNATKGR